jgi:hypothetical protein
VRKVQRLIIPGLIFCAAMAPATSFAGPERDDSTTSANAQTGPNGTSGIATVSGTVTGAESRWNDRGDRIFTHLVIELGDGSTMTVRQPGGSVDGIGMVQFPSPPLLQAGDYVEARVTALGEARVTARGEARVTGPAVSAGSGRSLPSWSLIDVTSLVRAPGAGSSDPVTLPESELEQLETIIDGKTGEPARITGGTGPRANFVRTMTDGGAPLHWGSGCTYLVFDSAGTTHLAADEEFAIMEKALQHWRDSTASCSYMKFMVEERRSMEVGYDGFNVVKFREDRWCRPAVGDKPEECYAFNAAGLTTLTFIDNPESKRYGEILDADIELNATERFAISANGETLAPADGRDLADLSNTFTHEVGHFLGLDHACRTSGEPPRLDHEGNEVPLCSGDLLEATMHPTQDNGETKKATLEQDDIDGACAIHPLAEDPKRCARVDLTPERSYCTIAPGATGAFGTPGADAGTSPVAFLAMFLGAALLLRRRRAAA